MRDGRRRGGACNMIGVCMGEKGEELAEVLGV